jgi:hypothetical protein
VVLTNELPKEAVTQRLSARTADGCPLNSSGESARSPPDLLLTFCRESPPVSIGRECERERAERTEQAAPEEPHHWAFSSCVSASLGCALPSLTFALPVPLRGMATLHLTGLLVDKHRLPEVC